MIVIKEDQLDESKLLELEQQYESVLNSDPESNVFCILADIQYKLGKVDKATGVLIRGLVHHKNNITARFLLGKIYYDRWLIEQAKKEMEKVVEFAPDNIEAAKLLSEIYKSEDDFEKALHVLEKANVFHPNDQNLLKEINLLREEVSKKQSESTIHVFQTPMESRKVNPLKVEDMSSNSELYTETMLNLYIEQGEFDKARETIGHLYKTQAEIDAAIEKLEKNKLNKMNKAAGFGSESREDK